MRKKNAYSVNFNTRSFSKLIVMVTIKYNCGIHTPPNFKYLIYLCNYVHSAGSYFMNLMIVIANGNISYVHGQ